MTMKIEIVGGWGGFPPMKKNLQKVEMKMKVRMKCNDNKTKNEMTMKIEDKITRKTKIKLK